MSVLMFKVFMLASLIVPAQTLAQHRSISEANLQVAPPSPPNSSRRRGPAGGRKLFFPRRSSTTRRSPGVWSCRLPGRGAAGWS